MDPDIYREDLLNFELSFFSKIKQVASSIEKGELLKFIDENAYFLYPHSFKLDDDFNKQAIVLITNSKQHLMQKASKGTLILRKFFMHL